MKQVWRKIRKLKKKFNYCNNFNYYIVFYFKFKGKIENIRTHLNDLNELISKKHVIGVIIIFV